MGTEAGPAVPREEWPPRLFLISDAARVGEERLVACVRSAAAAGLRGLLLREPEASVGALRHLAEAVREAAGAGFALAVSARLRSGGAERIALARELGAAGVHLGAARPDDVGAARELARGELSVGYSAHSVAEARAAFERGAEYVTLGPVLAPRSKPAGGEPFGLDGLRSACRELRGAVWALGGIDAPAARAALAAGARGVAVIGAVLDAGDPAAAGGELLRAVENAAP